MPLDLRFKVASPHVSTLGRNEWASFAVPLGSLEEWPRETGGMPKVLKSGQGAPCVLGPPAGVRHGRMIHVRTNMAPGEELSDKVTEEPFGALPYSPTTWVIDRLADLIPIPVSLRDDFEDRLAFKIEDHAELVWNDAALHRWRIRGRMTGRPGNSDPLVFEAYVDIFTGQDVVPIVFYICNSSPNHAGDKSLDALWVETGEVLHLDYANRQGVAESVVVDGKRLTGLVRNTAIGNAHGVGPYRGAILALNNHAVTELRNILIEPETKAAWSARYNNLLARAEGPLRAIAGHEVWASDPRGWGPFGTVPVTPPRYRGDDDKAGADARAAAFWSGYMSPTAPVGNMFDSRPLGMALNPNQTGGQDGMGAMKGARALAITDPRHISELLYSTPALRGIHNRELDCSPFRAEAHPDAIFWDSRIHCAQTPPDTLGQGCPEEDRTDHGWEEKNHQHAVSNTDAAAVWLSGCPMLHVLWTDQAEVYLAGHNVDPRWTNHTVLNEARAFGRVGQTLCQAYLTTGDPTIPARWLTYFQEVVLKRWQGKTTLAKNPTASVIVYSTTLDARTKIMDPQGALHPAWIVWNEAIGVRGLHACWMTFGDKRYKSMAQTMATTIVRHGIMRDPKVTDLGSPQAWILYDSVRWLEDLEDDDGRVVSREGRPLPVHRYQGWEANGTGWFWRWVLPALVILRRYLQEADALTPTEIGDLSRCNAILESRPEWTNPDWREVEWLAV